MYKLIPGLSDYDCTVYIGNKKMRLPKKNFILLYEDLVIHPFCLTHPVFFLFKVLVKDSMFYPFLYFTGDF